MRHLNTFVSAALLASLLAAANAHAERAPSPIFSYSSLALSADGERLAAINSLDMGGNSTSSIVVRDVATGKEVARYSGCANCRLDAPSWSPDQTALAFIGSDAKAGTATVFVARDGKVSALTTIKGVANTARWSPDGKQIALLATLNAKKQTGAVEAGAPLVGEIGSEADAQRIALVPAIGGEPKLVSPADTYVYEYNWTPDGNGFAVTSAKGDGDSNWWVATLGHVDIESGKLRIIAAPKMQVHLPNVSPDGRTVAFIGGLMSDFGVVGGDIYTVPLAGGEPVNVTPGYAGSFNGIAWRGKRILASVLAGSDAAVVAIEPAARTARKVWSGPVTATASRDGRFVFSADGAVAASVHEDYETAPRIVAGRLPDLVPITRDNAGYGPQVRTQNVTWTNEGFDMQGWLIGPRAIEAGKKYPMIVLAHGGPASASTPRFVSKRSSWRERIQGELVDNGYFIFLPNPRGSFGQGAAFTAANKRDFGGGDWRDILAGVDAAIKAAPIDGERLGLMGHSYGGFMTMWGVTQNQRFKAAVAGAGVSNWISYYGQNGIDQWMIPFFGASMYDDPAVYRKSSPIEYIKGASTPTLIYVGERDVETPAVQSMEFWKGLRAMGTPTSLLIFEGEGHAIRKPEHQKQQRDRTVEWFNRYLK